MKITQAFTFIFGRLFNKNGVFINYSLLYLKRKRSIDRNYLDYIRLATLELVAEEINSNGLNGAVAELGVYKGKFARYINQYFPDRKLYLFDTFEGFSADDIRTELEQNYSSGSQDFSNTSVKAVLGIMPFPDKCIIKKGFFPKTAEGIEEGFVFVSIDADLYDPILNGLKFFYPKLLVGGYIFIHDYNNDSYQGAKQAVEEFCLENKISIIPLPDAAGSAILKKN